jgi:type I restriction enzyme M protein
MAASDTTPNGNHDLPFAKTLFEGADRLRGSVESSEYKHLTLGLLFLKYISDAFERRHHELDGWTRDRGNEYFTENEEERGEILEDRDEYISQNVFWVPEDARFGEILKAASRPDIAQRIDQALDEIERDNPEQLRGVLPKVYARAPLQPEKLGQLVATVAKIGFSEDEEQQRDVLGRTYEYFIKRFARAEGHRGGEFYTPGSVTRTLVEMLQPFEGRVLDPACGSGGLFVQSANFVQAHGGRARQISLLGQENTLTTWRIAKMNLAIHALGNEIRQGDSLLDDKFPGLKADFVLANPPFNMEEWGAAQVAKDPRWVYGAPPDQNANFAWIQHFIHHLTSDGRAGFVMANSALTSNQNGEDKIRTAIVLDDIVDCVVALPAGLFYTTPIPACLWFLDRNKASANERDRRGETLFIDARKLGQKITRTQIELDENDIEQIVGTYHSWRDGTGYENIRGFCKSATISEIEAHGFSLLPGLYAGAKVQVADGVPFDEVLADVSDRLHDCFDRSDALRVEIEATLTRFSDGG